MNIKVALGFNLERQICVSKECIKSTKLIYINEEEEVDLMLIKNCSFIVREV